MEIPKDPQQKQNFIQNLARDVMTESIGDIMKTSAEGNLSLMKIKMPDDQPPHSVYSWGYSEGFGVIPKESINLLQDMKEKIFSIFLINRTKINYETTINWSVKLNLNFVIKKNRHKMH